MSAGDASLVDDLAAEIRVRLKRRRVEAQESRRDRYRSSEVVSRNVEDLKSGLVQRRKRTVEPVRVEPERAEPVQLVQTVGNRTGEIVVREIKYLEVKKQKNRRRKRAGETVLVDEKREVRNRTGERVVGESQDSELVEASQSVGSELASETEALENEMDHPALRAFHALPLTVIEALVELVEELVGFRLEREQRNGVGWQYQVRCWSHQRRRFRGGHTVNGDDDGKEIAEDDEKRKIEANTGGQPAAANSVKLMG
ncbi:hypothetical protein CFP56_038201 [Quercus suber]|uniref:Uncharacterized protein n=1 Tax=Quercus suber TaxID=58331 RepID=A0AAW0J435_QUESU